jgi:hypothetical protein
MDASRCCTGFRKRALNCESWQPDFSTAGAESIKFNHVRNCTDRLYDQPEIGKAVGLKIPK